MASYQYRNNLTATKTSLVGDDNHIYVNVEINSSTGSPSTENTTLATATVSKSIPILVQASRYHLIVDRFEINGRMLPLFIFNPLETYTVRITTGAGVDHDVNLIHVNNQGLTANQIGFYYYYTYQDVLDIINTALVTAATAAGTTSPFITWDTDAQRFTIFGESADFNRSLGGAATISFNSPIYRLFPGWSYDALAGGFYRLRMFNHNDNLFTPTGTLPSFGNPPLPTANDYIFLRDQFSVVDKWNPIDSIIFVSNKISLKETYASINNINQNNTNAGTLAILTDFKLDAANSGDPRKTLIYNPSVYRLLDLYSSAPINTIDISVYFTDKETQQLNPIRVFEGDKMSIKLLFQKKEIFE